MGDEDDGGCNGCSGVAAVGCFVGGGDEEIVGGSAIDMLSLRDASRPTHPDIKVTSIDFLSVLSKHHLRNCSEQARTEHLTEL